MRKLILSTAFGLLAMLGIGMATAEPASARVGISFCTNDGVCFQFGQPNWHKYCRRNPWDDRCGDYYDEWYYDEPQYYYYGPRHDHYYHHNKRHWRKYHKKKH